MKILLCHNFYQQAGGEDRVFADEAQLLESHGHEVFRFTKHNDAVREHSRVGLAAGTVWNRAAFAELKRLVKDRRPDVVHFHNTLPLISPAGYYAARSRGAAVVQTLHNYRFVCPSATLFRCGTVCEECVGRLTAWPAVRHGCYRNSRVASGVVAAMLAFHRTLRTYRRAVDRYIACSEFSKRKLVSAGLPGDKVAVKPNFILEPPKVNPVRGDYAMYLGRLSPEKGVNVLLDAWPQLAPTFRLKLAGNGPLDVRVREAAARSPHIEWLPGKSDEEVQALMAGAKFLIIPSINYEGFPKTIVESLSVGTPVVASALGAMAELIDDGRTGRLFRAGDASHLADVVRQLYGDEESLTAMREHARREYEELYTAERNYELLMEVYADAIAVRHAGKSGAARRVEVGIGAEMVR